jgi:hypothetical protein
MTKPTSADPAAVDPTRHALKGAADSLKATDENTDPDDDSNNEGIANQGLMTIYEIDAMGGAVPTGPLSFVVENHLSSEADASEEQ